MASIVFAGGGTAGHVEPALAVARMWKSLNPDDVITFLGTAQGLENSLVPSAGFSLINIPKVSISRKASLTWLRIPQDLVASVRACRSVLQKADLLFGFGGYVSAPAYLAARSLGIPIVIHEANAHPGWANRMGARLTPFLAIARAVTTGRFSNALITGLPLRSDVVEAVKSAEGNWLAARVNAKRALGFDQDKELIFIMGGSQGSVAINSVIEKSLPMLESKKYSILHSVGKLNDVPSSSGFYKPIAYVDQMALAYLASDLIIARSGAVTCSEFHSLGRYALFIPLPIGNGEQSLNAAEIVSEGRAQIVEQKNFTVDFLSSHIDELMTMASQAPIAGSDRDVDAALKIVALGHHALGDK